MLLGEVVCVCLVFCRVFGWAFLGGGLVFVRLVLNINFVML